MSVPGGRPRVALRADLRPAAVVLGAVAVLGVPLGGLWAVLAPATVVRRGADGAAESLLSQSEHRFDALAVFVLLGLAAGVLTGAATWLLRRWRGPAILVAATAGALAAAWLARYTGQLLTTDAVIGPAGELTARAPTIGSPWVVLAPPLGVALAYSTAVAANGHDHLGRQG